MKKSDKILAYKNNVVKSTKLTKLTKLLIKQYGIIISKNRSIRKLKWTNIKNKKLIISFIDIG